MKVSEIDPLAIFLTLKILIDEIDPDSGSEVGRPFVLVGGEWQPVDNVSVETKHGSDFAQAEVHAGAQIEAGSENRADLALHANNDELRIKGNSATNGYLVASCFSFDVALQATNPFGYGVSLLGVRLRVRSWNQCDLRCAPNSR